jgi:hypothetical protein
MKTYRPLFLLNVDSAAGTGADSALDPLATPVGDIDLSRPIAPPSNYEMSIAEASVIPNKAQTGRNLLLKWQNTKEIKSTKGDMMAVKQLTLSQYMGLQATEKKTAKAVAQDIARLAKGVGLSASITPLDVINNPSILVGKLALVKVGHKQETSEYPEGNEIKGVVLEG